MAGTININQLLTEDILLSDFLVKADENGIATKTTIKELINKVATDGDVAFKGSVAIADDPTLDGWYLASESGVYPNVGGLEALAQSVTIFIISGGDTIFSKIDIPLTLPFDATPTPLSTNAVESGGVFDRFNALATNHIGDNSDLDDFILNGLYPVADYPIGTIHIEKNIDNEALFGRITATTWMQFPNQARLLSYYDALNTSKLDKSGGVMSGTLQMSGNVIDGASGVNTADVNTTNVNTTNLTSTNLAEFEDVNASGNINLNGSTNLADIYLPTTGFSTLNKTTAALDEEFGTALVNKRYVDDKDDLKLDAGGYPNTALDLAIGIGANSTEIDAYAQVSPAFAFAKRVSNGVGNSFFYAIPFDPILIEESKKPSLYCKPNATAVGKLFTQKPTSGVGDFTVSRPSGGVGVTGNATYTGRDGLLKTALPNVPRIDFSDDPYGVLLTEPQSTNELIWSEDFSQASWSKDANVGVLSQDTISPTGVLDGTTLKDSNIGGTGVVAPFQSVTVEPLTNYTFSLFAKKDQLDWVYLNLVNFTSVSNLPVYFNLANGTLGSTIAGVTTKIEDYGSGWYRCSATFTSDSVDTLGNVAFGLGIGDNLRTIPLDGTSSIKVFGAMFEKQSYATSYIKTEGTTITRIADVVTDGGDVNTFNSQEGVLFWSASCNENSPTSKALNIRDGLLTQVNNVVLYFYESVLSLRVYVDSVSILQIQQSITIGQKYDIVATYNNGDYYFYIDGVEINNSLGLVGFNPNDLKGIDLARGSVVGSNLKTSEIKYYKSIAEAQVDLPYIV